MNIVETYDIQRIIINLEIAFCIDGMDYAEKNIDTIIKNIKNRIIRQYQVDLTECKITDESLNISGSRNPASLFIENVAQLHSQLCGYLQIVRYTSYVTIKPINVNYLGFTDKALMGFLQLCIRQSTIPAIANPMEAVKLKVSSINNCIEKKLFLIMIVAYELGYNEVMAAIAEILYLGGKV